MAISNKIVRRLAMVLRIALGLIFVYAAYVKLFQFTDGRLHLLPWQLFAMAIDSYQLLPQTAVEILARTLPWFELALGFLLIAGRWLRFSSISTSLLLAVFLSLMVRAYVKGQEISCGCFGPGEIISWKTLLRDGSLLAASLFVTAGAFWRGRARRESLDRDSLPTTP
jgi:putative oxidoreductase